MQLNAAVEKLQQLLYNIPNIPNDSFLQATVKTDNEEVFRAGDVPKLAEGLFPTGNSPKNMTSLTLNWAIKSPAPVSGV
jgi:seryl-tRNA synthetase